jgi:hypothetical protein
MAYLHVLQWNGNSTKIEIPNLGIDIKSCRLAHGGQLDLKKEKSGYSIELDILQMRPLNTIIELEYEDNIMEVEPREISSNSLSYKKTVTASSNPDGHWSNFQWVELNSITNGDWSGSFWEPENGDKNPWIEIDLGEAKKINKAIVYERGSSIKAYEIHVLDGENWVKVHQGSEIGNKSEINFREVSAQRVKLTVTDFKDIPGIYEIALFN